jgi:hypothetical protein
MEKEIEIGISPYIMLLLLPQRPNFFLIFDAHRTFLLLFVIRK